MGYYIQVPGNKGKARQIADLYGGRILDGKPKYSDIPSDQAIICVLDNGMFEAAGFAYSEQEFIEFATTGPSDARPRTWLVMDRQKACELAGYR